MTVWIIFAVMMACALAAALWPLHKRKPSSPPAADGRADRELAVYRDQLAQVEADLAAGVLAAGEADAAKAEISRRMLAASGRRQSQDTPSAAGIGHMAVTVLGIFAIPAAALAFYSLQGKPHLKDRPHAARQSESPFGQPLHILVQRAEAQLRKAPDNVQGWKVLAPSYKRLKRYADAMFALEQVMRLEGRKPAILAEYGEAVMLNEAGVISDKARKAFDEAVKLDPKQPKALYYLAMAQAQDGSIDKALTSLRAMLKVLPEKSPWRRRVAQVIARGEGRQTRAKARPPALDKGAVKAAREMTPQQRRQMIEGMVSRLAARLDKKPDDLTGWLRLITAYKVLGRPAELKTAIDKARKTFAGKPEALKQIDALARQG
jgi:cytochrome c-type biogenesis protein CcmH